MKRTRLKSEMDEAKAKAKAFMTAAENENNRELTPEERTKVQGHLDEAKTLKAQIDRIDGDAEMRKSIEALQVKDAEPSKPGATGSNGKPVSLGAAFVASEIYEAVKAGKHRSAGFNASAEFLEFGATTLDESTGSGGKLVLPDYQQGILSLLFRQIKVTDLLAPGTTESNSVEYMQETTFTNNAAVRAEGAAAAESVLVFNRTAETVRSIDSSLPVTNEMLEDQSQTASYIDGRLRLGVSLAEEDELLNGDGTGVHLTGLMNRANLATAVARGTDTNADAIFKQIMAIMTNAFVMPEGVVINPTNWTTMVLAKDGNGTYYGPGPFQAAQTPVIWGLPAAVTPAITANTSLVGAYRSCAQRFVRRGITVSASNSHSDYFTKRLVSILAGLREALAVYRPGAFGKVTGLN
jgi:HK97 family phage major capsid protein